MCVDYTSLNKACLKDPFPLLCIDEVVDSTSRCETLCILDAYFGYHQIMMKESDQLMTNLFHHPIRIVLLRDDVVRSKKMQELHTSSVCSSVSGTSLGIPLRLT
jgi:hypothetical protein